MEIIQNYSRLFIINQDLVVIRRIIEKEPLNEFVEFKQHGYIHLAS